jgi:hypothetical protein
MFNGIIFQSGSYMAFFKLLKNNNLINPNPDWHEFCFINSNKNRRHFNQGGGYENVKKFGFSRWSFYIFDFNFGDLSRSLLNPKS